MSVNSGKMYDVESRPFDYRAAIEADIEAATVERSLIYGRPFRAVMYRHAGKLLTTSVTTNLAAGYAAAEHSWPTAIVLATIGSGSLGSGAAGIGMRGAVDEARTLGSRYSVS